MHVEICTHWRWNGELTKGPLPGLSMRKDDFPCGVKEERTEGQGAFCNVVHDADVRTNASDHSAEPKVLQHGPPSWTMF